MVPDYAKGARAPRLGVIANHNTNLLNEVSPSGSYRASRDGPNYLLLRLLEEARSGNPRANPCALIGRMWRARSEEKSPDRGPNSRAPSLSSGLALRLDVGREKVMLRLRVCRDGATVA